MTQEHKDLQPGETLFGCGSWEPRLLGTHGPRTRSSPPIRDVLKDDPVSDIRQTSGEALQAHTPGNASERPSTFSWHQGLPPGEAKQFSSPRQELQAGERRQVL